MKLAIHITTALLALLALLATARAEDQPHAYIPRPYGGAALSLNGGGYSPVSLQGSSGLRIDAPHFISDVEIGYDTTRKVNDNVPGNDTGHLLKAQARAFYRLRNGFYFGGGEQWSETKTLKYTKRVVRPAFGGGKDFLWDSYSLRVQSLYFTQGDDKANGTHGVETMLTYPSPSQRGHFFARMGVSIYRFHDTSFANGTQEQLKIWNSNHHMAAYVNYGLLYRF
jgi:hypothetical protein